MTITIKIDYDSAHLLGTSPRKELVKALDIRRLYKPDYLYHPFDGSRLDEFLARLASGNYEHIYADSEEKLYDEFNQEKFDGGKEIRTDPELPIFEIADFFETPGLAVFKRDSLAQTRPSEYSLKNKTEGLVALVAVVLFIPPKQENTSNPQHRLKEFLRAGLPRISSH